MIKVKQTFLMAGRFMLVATKRDGTQRVLADWFDNLILDAGLNRIGTASTIVGAMVGTGSSAPLVSQTALDAQIAFTSTTGTSAVDGVDTGDNYAYRRFTYRFAEGVAAGNLAEVGVGWSSGNCFSRALILDGLGDPTTITVLSDETLDVVYELRVYPPTTDVSDSMVLDGVTYDYVLRTARLATAQAGNFLSFTQSSGGMGATVNTSTVSATTGAGALGDIYSDVGGSGSIGPGSVSAQAYGSGSYLRAYRYTWGLPNGSSSFYNIRFSTHMGFCKASFSPAIPKNSSRILMLEVTAAWARKTI